MLCAQGIAQGGWDQTALFKGGQVGINNRDHEQLGFLSGGLRYDTRDSQRNPYRGLELGASFADGPTRAADDAVDAGAAPWLRFAPLSIRSRSNSLKLHRLRQDEFNANSRRWICRMARSYSF